MCLTDAFLWWLSVAKSKRIRNEWKIIAGQEAEERSGGQQGDRSSVGSSNSAPGMGMGIGVGVGVGVGVGGGGVRNGAAEFDTGRPLSATFGIDRRYSGGTIGIASMLGSLGTVISGRMGGESGVGSRASSILSGPGTPTDHPGASFAGLGATRRHRSVSAGVMAAGASYLVGDDARQVDGEANGASAGAEGGRELISGAAVKEARVKEGKAEQKE